MIALFAVSGRVQVDGFVNGVKIGKIANISELLKSKTKSELDNLNATAKSLCSKIKILMEVAGMYLVLYA